MEHGKAATLIGNRYVIEAPLGRGGMAVVSLAHDRATGDRVALKQLVLSGPATTMDRARMLFERECRTPALLRHPRIVRVFDFGVDDNIPYYTMELLDGGDLTERTPRPYARAQAIMAARTASMRVHREDACLVLQYQHQARMALLVGDREGHNEALQAMHDMALLSGLPTVMLMAARVAERSKHLGAPVAPPYAL